MRIYFARHGESQANRLNIISNRNLQHGLTPIGRRQAGELAERLQRRSISRIYTSPLLRAVETSSIIGRFLKVDYELADGLREFDCGIAEGRSDEAAWQLWQQEYEAWVFKDDHSYQIEGGESFSQVSQRFNQFIDGLIDSYSDNPGEVLCVAHGAIYNVMFPWIMHNVSPQMMLSLGFDYARCIVAEYRDGQLVCIEWNGITIGAG